MLERWFPRVSRVRDGDHIPVSPEVFPKDRIIGFADFPALGAKAGLLLMDR